MFLSYSLLFSLCVQCPDGTGCDICPNGTIVDDDLIVTIDGVPGTGDSETAKCDEWFLSICLVDGGFCLDYQVLLAECCSLSVSCIVLQRSRVLTHLPVVSDQALLGRDCFGVARMLLEMSEQLKWTLKRRRISFVIGSTLHITIKCGT